LYTAYLIAAIVLTLIILEGDFPIASLFECMRYLVFVARRAVPLHLQSFLSRWPGHLFLKSTQVGLASDTSECRMIHTLSHSEWAPTDGTLRYS